MTGGCIPREDKLEEDGLTETAQLMTSVAVLAKYKNIQAIKYSRNKTQDWVIISFGGDNIKRSYLR